MIKFSNAYRTFRKQLRKSTRFITLPNTIIFIGTVTILIYVFSYHFPFTDNAFVMTNVRPVAAQTQGYITNIYIQNGQKVTKGQKLFSVFNKPYLYTVEQLQADLEAAYAKLRVVETTSERDQKISQTRHRMYIKAKQDDEKYQKGYKIKSVSLITLQNSQQETRAAQDEWEAALKQLEIDQHSIEVQKKEIKSLTAKLKNAKVNLKLTNVYAQNDGIIQNLFLTTGSPVNVNEPMFSMVDTSDIYIQANFNETDLRNVRAGDKVTIFPRMYLWQKRFHGVVMSDFWSANRQIVDERTQLQNVINENQWILLPQRLPVIIKVTDPDPAFPLRVGTSAYVYIKTR